MNSVMNLTSMETYDVKTDQWTEIEYNVLSVTGATSHVIGQVLLQQCSCLLNYNCKATLSIFYGQRVLQ